MRRLAILLLVVSCALAVAGCFPHPVVVGRTAKPNPFVGQTRFVLLPMDLTPAKRPRGETDEAILAFERRFVETMTVRASELDYRITPARTAPPGAFVIRAELVEVDPGVLERVGYTATGGTRYVKVDSHSVVRVHVTAPGGAEDVISAEHRQEPNALMMFQTGPKRTSFDGFKCALAAAEFIKRRIDGEPY